MPRLPTYTAKIDGGAISGGRRATAEDFGAVDLTGPAHAVQKAAAGFLQAKEEDERRSYLVGQAQIKADYSKRLQEAVVSGEPLEKINESMNAELSKLTEGMQTKAGRATADYGIANTNEQFQAKANHIEVQKAQLKAKVDVRRISAETQRQVLEDPTSLPVAVQDMTDYLTTYKGNKHLSPEWLDNAIDVETRKLNLVAAEQNARLLPEETIRAVREGKYNLDGDQSLQVVARAEATIRGRRVDDSYVRAEADRVKKDKDETATDSYFKEIMTGKFSMQKALDDPDLTPRSREHLALMAESRAKALVNGEGATNKAVKRELFLDITAPDGDQRKIYNADKIFAATDKGDINPTDAAWLMGIVANQKDENNRSFGQRLNGRMQVVASSMRSSPIYQAQPELAAAIQLQMVAEVEQKAAELRNEKKSPAALLDPDSKDYYFTPNRMKQIADDVQKQKSDLAPATKPGEVVVIDGTQWTFKGGDPSNRQNWQAVTLPDTRDEDFTAWMQATGGALKPGQNQQQAIAEWKGKR